MNSFGEIIDAFGGPGPFGEALAIPASHARTMKARGSIPPAYWPEVVEAAVQRCIPGINLELLAGVLAGSRGRNDSVPIGRTEIGRPVSGATSSHAEDSAGKRGAPTSLKRGGAQT